MQFSYYLATIFCLIGAVQSLSITYNNTGYDCNKAICNIFDTCKTDGDKQLCTRYVALLGRVHNKTFIPYAVATLLRHTDLLTTVSSGFGAVFYDFKEWIYVLEDRKGYLLSDSYENKAQLIPGDFDPHGWNDIMLIRMKTAHEKEGAYIAVDEKKLKTLTKKTIIRYTLTIKESNIFQKQFTRYRASQCQDMFAYDENVFFDDDVMYCESDEHMELPPPPELAPFLSGLPVFATWGDNRERQLLFGMRSLQSTDPHHRGVFLVTKLKYHCDWLEYHRIGTDHPCRKK